VWPAGQFGSRQDTLLDWKGFGANLAELQQTAASAGHFNPIVDFDGVSRRVPLVVRHEGAYYEALSLAMVRYLLGGVPVRPGFPEGKGTIEWLDVGGEKVLLRIPVDENGGALIPYRGTERSFPYVSAADVLKGRVDTAVLKGRAVLVGTTAPGLMDLRSTPVGATYPGVEIHANMIAGIMDGSLRQKPSYVLGAEVVELLLVGAALTLLLPLLSPLRASLPSVAYYYIWSRK
jgi:adenylate cyclase